ncbi:MAG: hypothetical protein FVQ82_14310 [Planctomycetes bacterium]|nr:hypothetical protein [Planctomycetota bacterium]
MMLLGRRLKWWVAYNFCYGSFVFGGYIATEENERKELKEKRIKAKEETVLRRKPFIFWVPGQARDDKHLSSIAIGKSSLCFGHLYENLKFIKVFGKNGKY